MVVGDEVFCRLEENAKAKLGFCVAVHVRNRSACLLHSKSQPMGHPAGLTTKMTTPKLHNCARSYHNDLDGKGASMLNMLTIDMAT